MAVGMGMEAVVVAIAVAKDEYRAEAMSYHADAMSPYLDGQVSPTLMVSAR